MKNHPDYRESVYLVLYYMCTNIYYLSGGFEHIKSAIQLNNRDFAFLTPQIHKILGHPQKRPKKALLPQNGGWEHTNSDYRHIWPHENINRILLWGGCT